MSHCYCLEVEASDLDELEHVNNARYLDYLERARTTWYDEAGLIERCVGEVERPEFGTVVVNVNIDFRAECHAGERLEVVTNPARVGTKSFVVSQRIQKEDGTLAAQAEVTSVVMDLRTRAAVALNAFARALFEG
jgi:thioesterase-3